MAIKVNVRYFAALRERAGIDQEALVTECKTVRELVDWLIEHRALDLPSPLVRAALNGKFADDLAELSEGDHIQLIPPVAGG